MIKRRKLKPVDNWENTYKVYSQQYINSEKEKKRKLN